MTQKRLKLGDVFAIPLPNGKFAFGRIYKDTGFGVYQHIGNTVQDSPAINDENYQFNTGVYGTDVRRDFIFVENRPFSSDEASWPPEGVILDTFTGRYKKYYKGKILPYTTREEGDSLEIVAIWGSNYIIERLMGSKNILEQQRENLKY